MLRKKGKLPGDTLKVKYTTEYSEDQLELLKDVLEDDDQFLLVDDLVATGGTLGAGVKAFGQTHHIVGCLCVLKVDPLWEMAKKHLHPYQVITLL